MYFAPSIADAIHALKSLDTIPRPYGDNEGDAINSSSVFHSLSSEHQELVDHAEQLLKAYTRTSHLVPNPRSINALKNNGYPAYLNLDQYDPYRLVGTIETPQWVLDISDQQSEESDY
ncbi:hypothetical protein ACDH60_08300 [Pseudomonas ficuserectae]|uniref:hypothetical protein n=1 Tax=Pseudomonas syringae group genomosp. 2 TaxID=251698 RepID=UPI00062BD246|nr:hypothetical protein [Pseudomonas amygdali]KKY58912.1 hypothetical protein AAY85_05085 [Pseudomonas amygdali pv. lachrymans]KPB97065.1 Uncharacterized protein AC501_4590 [Pseudomonas amygdali pv. lachrymans]WIO56664.1 hypothetical protein QO021_19190 [Pseudomonas amygdali pv. lachrymans]